MELEERMLRYQFKKSPFKLTLNEDVENPHETSAVTTTPEENGIQNMLQFLIKDEWDAIEGYNNTIQTLKDLGGYEDLCGVLQEISNEELVHVGQLQKSLESINPSASKIKEGETEASEQLGESSPEVNI